MRKSKILVATLAMVMCCAAGVGIAKVTNNGEATMITASAAELGEIKVGTHTGKNSWLASTNRVLIQLPASVPAGEYKIQEGSISLTRGGQTWTRGAENGFIIKNLENYAPDAFIELWHFGNDVGSTYAYQAGDVFVINGTFSNGTNSFTIKNAKVVVNSATTGDMYVEESATDMGRAKTETEHTWMNRHQYVLFKLNQSLEKGIYRPLSIENITVIRNGVVHKPSSNSLVIEVQSDKIFVDQTGYFESIRTSWTDVFQDGDIICIEGIFKNDTLGSFKIEKTSILVESTTVQTVMPIVTWTNEAGEVINSEEVKSGSVLQQPATPDKEAAEGEIVIFDGWYNGDTKWDFSKAVTGDITLTPKFSTAINLGAGYTNANGMWMGTSYYFGLQPNVIANGAHLRPTSADCMKVTRGAWKRLSGIIKEIPFISTKTVYIKLKAGR